MSFSSLSRLLMTVALAFALVPLPTLAQATLVHRYSFTSDASDSVGSADGTLLGDASISGGAVALDGAGDYVDLPNGFIAELASVTFETWVIDNGSANWARIFDFGFSTAGEGLASSGTNYLFLTPQTGGGILRAGIKVTNNPEQMVDWAGTRLPTGSPKHVVWTIDSSTQTGTLYVDGVLVGQNTAVTFNPSSLGNTYNNWLGRSQFSADAYFNGSIAEFRIYNGALSAAEVAANYAWGPDVAASGPVQIVTQPQSQSVVENRPVTFSVFYGGTRPVNIQWFRNNVPIAAATNDSYTIPFAALADHNALFKAALTNSYRDATYTAISSAAQLSVTADTNAPVLVRADSVYPNEVLVTFSEAVLPSTATNTSNYTITRVGGSLAVTAARFGNTASNIVLTTAPQTIGTNYTLTVNQVRDIAVAVNLIAANSQATFVASPYLGVNIGDPSPTGTFTATTSGFVVTAAGSGIGGTADQFTFGWQPRTNNFDVRVRVAALGFSSAWARAGLMARDGLNTNAMFAASFATPGPAGCHFEARTFVGGTASMSGSFPVNYPDTWLRLRRAGNTFEGFASLDGQTWNFLGTATIGMSPTVQVGFALTAASPSATATAVFDSDGNAGGTIVTNLALPFEPLGPSSRRTPLVISEIMYNPPDAWGGANEFIEIWNSGLVTEDLTGHTLTGEMDYRFPDGTSIAPGQFLAVARDPAAAQSFYGVTFLGPYTNKLSNSGGALRLRNELGGILLEVSYNNKAPWPVAANGTGHSLVLTRPSHGESDPRAWSASDAIKGTPGTFEHYGAEPARSVVINEFLAHTDDPMQDYIELFNAGSQSVDLSGAWLSDAAGTNKFRIPDGTTLGARSFRSFNQSTLGFSLSADGESIFLVNSNQTRVLDAVAFEGQANGISSGRFPDGAPGLQELSAITEGAANAAPLTRPVVINEIMYHPISDLRDDEYVEIHNRGATAVNLGGWQLDGGINYAFPANTLISGGGYIVVAANRTNLPASYPQLKATNTFGNFDGLLRDSGERIVLSMPEDLVSTNAFGVAVTNHYQIPVDEVTYLDGGRWGKWSDGGGSSLELMDPRADNRQASNWADSDESAKAAWTTINVTNVLENGQAASVVHEGNNSFGVANRFEIFLQGPGEALVDNLAFLNNGGTSLVSNGDFESGTSGWTLGGVLRKSFAQTGVGVGSSQALHLVAADRGDTGPNKVSSTLTATATTGSPNTGTISASVRWLKGNPHILFRIRGNWMEVSQRLNAPSNCGTPGLPNSRYVGNAGPAISEVAHGPVLPAANQPVVVSARVSDPDGLAAVQLKYRVDPTASYTTVTMTNDYGVYRAVVPGQASGSLVAFTVSATDSAGAGSTFPAEAPTRECHVRWGETVMPGSIGTYRLWLTAANISFWTSRERNANDGIDATFVYGNTRAIYNVDTMYSGSPFHTPAYNGPLNAIASDYEVNFHPGELLLGAEPFVLTAYDVNDGSFFFNDDSAQVDLTGTWIGRKLGLQYNYRRHVYVFMNGIRRGTIYDDAQQPNGDMLDQYHAGETHSQLRKIESWFEFADDAQSQGSTYATITRVNKGTGEIDPKRYRWNWRPRATDDPDDWTALTNLITVVNDTASSNYEARVRAWMDVRSFLGPVATHHICGSWDSYAYSRGKNMYAYQSDQTPWRLLMWDIELSLGAGGDGPSTSIYAMFDTTLYNMITTVPAFHREYLGAIQKAVDTTLVSGAADALLDERYASFRQHNLPLISPAFIKSWIAQRRSYLLSALPKASFAVTNSAYTVVSGNNTITLGGTAPLTVDSILINGAAYPITWTSVTDWRILVPLNGGTNLLAITATDRDGSTISGASGLVTANYTGNTVTPEGQVVFNEIQFQPAVPGAAFVEFFNTHSNFTFDLSNWRINGLGYTFPPGSKLAPRSCLVLTENTFAYGQAYGLTNVAFDQYNGTLDPDGETLTLFRPGTGTNEIVVDRVRYEAAPPWAAATSGYSLQLVDASQDNSRVANWSIAPASMPAVAATNFVMVPFADTWKYLQTSNLDGVNWTATNYDDAAWPSGPGLLAYETSNIATTNLVKTTLINPTLATNNVLAGHAYYFRKTLNLPNALSGYTLNASAYIDDGAVFYVNGNEVVPRIRMPGGVIENMTMASAQASGSGGDATAVDTFTIPASAFVVGTNVIAVEVHQQRNTSSDIVFGLKIDATNSGSVAFAPAHATPGVINSVVTNLPAFPPVWLNELQADNATGPLDNYSQRDPWTELHNTATTNLSLAGYYLSDSYTNLTRWAFPAGAFVPAGGFLVVWCDNQTSQTTAEALHAGFRPASGSGQLVLSRNVGGAVQIVDYLNYHSLPANWSYGAVPDAQPFYRDNLFYFTPGATNNGASAPITVFINEWMADNTLTLPDPEDSSYEDWFELYNPGTNAVDLGGYFLTDDPANKFLFQVPNNGHYIVPPGGYLLVWADNESGQNNTNHPDLHADFALAKGGETIGLFAADGTAIDVVTFPAQTANVSQGRFPNGAANIYSMPLPTPRAANILPNTAPTLAAISNRVVILGQPLSFNVSGSDADLPPQTLTYSLSGAPPGATIGLYSGLFTWTPTAPGTNTITVVVSDDGIPSLSASRMFTVTTVIPPELSSVTASPNQFTFSWQTYPGQTYRIEYKDDLADPAWIAPADGTFTGTGGILTYTIEINEESPQRFFRIQVLP